MGFFFNFHYLMHYIYAKTREEKTKFSMSKKGVRMMNFKRKNDVRNYMQIILLHPSICNFKRCHFPHGKTQERQHVFSHSFTKALLSNEESVYSFYGIFLTTMET